MAATGHCLCGAVKFSAEGVEADVHACHCSNCRHWAGGPVLAASVGQVRFEGDEHIGRYESSAWGERGFCANCGTNLFFRLKESDHYLMVMGNFDDQSRFTLAGEIYIDEKPPGYDFAGDHSRMTGQEFMASIAPQD